MKPKKTRIFISVILIFLSVLALIASVCMLIVNKESRGSNALLLVCNTLNMLNGFNLLKTAILEYRMAKLAMEIKRKNSQDKEV